MRITGIFIYLFLLSSCSSIHYKRSEVLERENDISHLKRSLDEAKVQEIDIFSPTYFERAQDFLNESIDFAQRSKEQSAGNDLAKEGLKFIKEGQLKTTVAKKFFQEILLKRDDAKKAHAHTFFKSEFLGADEQLRKACQSLDNDDQPSAIKVSAELLSKFKDLESLALKEDLNKSVLSAHDEAVSLKANIYAPITLEKSLKELEIAQKIVELNAADLEKAKQHADKARLLSLRAKGISELAILFEKENYSHEQIALWYQEQLEKLYKPFNAFLPFELSNHDLILSFQTQIDSLLKVNHELKDKELESQKNMEKLHEKLSSSINEKESIFEKRKNLKENIDFLKHLFSENEAIISEENDDILIRPVSFLFGSGLSNLEPNHFGLLNKVAIAILKLPKSKIVVEGYTAKTENNELDKAISEERAKNVAEFLAKTAGIGAQRIESIGKASEKPLNKSDAEEEKAKNHRIEFVIKNIS